MIELILGGARSGKSRLAEKTAAASGLKVIYIATATVYDDEMADRVEHHKQQRPDHWPVVEETIELAKVLEQHSSPDHCLLVDCLTLWLTNLLCSEDKGIFQKQRHALLECLPKLKGKVLFVSNEVGMGVVPMGELTRQFCDESGRLHQDIAELADKVTLTVAGLPHVLKEQS
ncbi:bifunctional adenosylcobinamide kinase/adenosylcobinamide-phosphate guanylyltransferase [Endozoicomonas sp. OPT23]|uniref:bifunctional adenosylcobinamide kinase/adenosylcobinamide-phosphate guanylyltransferase n=1 Tax=Endozoicomonas sp. OPT23 TaxID=2072845 RepID=UPI00129BB7ED|nr:bifunctional adenosylcobinamide kinase/adenosylcobinamide-phosphate guanylyltransferase [Endozoicomonas sp. OPT23]MRI31936.1 bifunctional adenosylcobinamide kinase/adenosylcobinamide-phosphate guanylyltransferase [Endozoicomonas sp. OPT23]